MANAIHTLKKSLLFNYATTYQNDYQGGEIHNQVYEHTKFKSKPLKPKETCKSIKDVHTMTQYKAESIPFDMLHVQRPIIGTDPRNVQKRYDKTLDEERDMIRQTRPRVVITPQVSMDDIDDPGTRDILLDAMYTTNAMRGQREAISETVYVNAPMPGLPSSARPIVLPPYTPSVVPPEWRMDTVKWDGRQLRADVNPSAEFWLGRDISSCGACRETKIFNNFRKTKCLTEARKR